MDLQNKGLRSLKPQNLSLIHEANFGTESKHSPSAQPGMLKDFENAMEAAAESGNPMWLALLASWMQAMAKLRLAHLLRRSFPVKLYKGWMLFFCKQGKQEHDCAGFCWGRTFKYVMWLSVESEVPGRLRQKKAQQIWQKDDGHDLPDRHARISLR